jgi:dUTP pyrophosphatase
MSNERVLVGTGLAIDLDDPNCMWTLLPKSGLGHKKGLVLGNLVGVVDSDYHLEVFVSCWNSGPSHVTINRGDFICQAVLVPVLRVVWNEVLEFDRTVSRVGGFGSTGKR